MNRRILLGLIVAIPVLILGWWLASPLFREDEVDEELPDNIVLVTNEVKSTMDTAAATTIPIAEAMPTEMMTEDGQILATEIKRGSFRDGVEFHAGSGDAILYRLSDGRHLLRFENFSVTNGPDLHVYLVPRANTASVDVSGFVDLGSLKGNVGDQNYFISAEIAIPDEASIVIWCQPFSVLFSVASLTP